MFTALSLSDRIMIASPRFCTIRISFNKFPNGKLAFKPTFRAYSSASQISFDTINCLRARQWTALPPTNKIHPVMCLPPS